MSANPDGEVVVRPGDVVALVGPDGSRRRYLCSTLGDSRKNPAVIYELSDHCEGSRMYDHMLDERTVIVLRWDGPAETGGDAPDA